MNRPFHTKQVLHILTSVWVLFTQTVVQIIFHMFALYLYGVHALLPLLMEIEDKVKVVRKKLLKKHFFIATSKYKY